MRAYHFIIVDSLFFDLFEAIGANDVPASGNKSKVFDLGMFAFNAVFPLLCGSFGAFVGFLSSRHPTFDS
jgi:hypothetical protein